jgi:type III pantothenate kinase
MSGPLLVIDIGNTNAKCGCVSDGVVSGIHRVSHTEDAEQVFAGLENRYAQEPLMGVAIASVVPARTPLWIRECEDRFGLPVWELKPEQPQPIPVQVPKPSRVGADRLANAVAAIHRLQSPVMVADFGTALTFDVATPEGGYVGGVIAPGINLMYSYFSEKTALLPALEFTPCRKAIGTTTEEAMHSGAFFGYRGMVRELSARVREELGTEAPLLATGGYAAEVLDGFGEPVEVIPHLTLEGIALCWEGAQASA